LFVADTGQGRNPENQKVDPIDQPTIAVASTNESDDISEFAASPGNKCSLINISVR